MVAAETTAADVDVVMYWPHAQRSTVAVHEYIMSEFVTAMSRAAAMAGMDLRFVTADDIVVLGSADGTRVLVSGEEVRPDSCFFHTKLMTWPDAQGDAWRLLSLFELLEAAGFHTTVPTSLNILTNDKLLTLLRYAGPASVLPTLRISTRHFTRLPSDDLGMEYPVVVKPANWGGGYGIMRADTRRQLEAILQLAGAGEVTMVIQPWLGADVVDVRVYCIDGAAYKAITRRPRGGAIAGNYLQGGVTEIIDVPREFVEPSEEIAKALGLNYTCVDFLKAADGRFWLSEVEVDGATIGDELVEAKFRAYRRRFEHHKLGAARRRPVASDEPAAAR